MKGSKISTLTAGIAFLLVIGVLSGCGEEPEEAVNQSEGMAIEPVPSEETAGAPMAAIEDTKDFDFDNLEGIEELESIENFEEEKPETDIFEGISETTEEFIDKSKETKDQLSDDVIGLSDESIDTTQGVGDKVQPAPSPAVEKEKDQVPAMADDATEVVTVTPKIIRSVQQALSDAGYNPGPVDGISGSRTLAALENFQKQNNIAAGQFTKETLQALGVNY
jgi:Putative peptidoglycan binding domain